jgi:hypothetical protein
MANVWGPMGWLTLHSVAAAYPDFPSNDLKNVTTTFLNKFAETITCQYCRDHFTRILSVYRSKHPEYLDNRRNFFLFTARAHNSVNKRLDKPILQTVADCLQTLRNASTSITPSQFRLNYFSYVARTWIHELGGEGRIHFNMVNEMKTINQNYFLQNDTEFSIEMEEGDVLEYIDEGGTRYSPTTYKISTEPVVIGFRKGKLLIPGPRG